MIGSKKACDLQEVTRLFFFGDMMNIQPVEDSDWQLRQKFAQAFRLISHLSIVKESRQVNPEDTTVYPEIVHSLRIPKPENANKGPELIDCDLIHVEIVTAGCSKAHAAAQRTLWVRLVQHLINVFDIRKDELYES